jgi:beta-lactamase class A
MLPLLAALSMMLTQGTDSLRSAIEARIKQNPTAEVGVAYIDLQSGDTLYIHADTVFHAASTMKLPVMLELYRRVSAGGISLDQGLLVVNQFASIVDGSPYAQDPGQDSDSSLYKLVGTRVTIRALIRLMITRSSNLATNTLIALAGPDQVNAMLRSLGVNTMNVLRGVEDLKAFDKGLNNTTTARDLATLLAAIETGRAADAAATRAMKEILLAQEFNNGIPAGLPSGTKVAHKTGDLTAHSHDAAIVYPEGRKPYVLVVLTRGIQKPAESSQLIVDISRLVYAHAMASAVAAR